MWGFIVSLFGMRHSFFLFETMVIDRIDILVNHQIFNT